MIDKSLVPTKLIWADLEMTGLDFENDVILEVAIIITDFDFKTLESYEARVKQSHDTVVSRMEANTWWQEYPKNRDDFIANLASGKTMAEVEQELIALVEKYFGNDPAVLAGNSIHNDRNFIKHWMPDLDSRLHYRMLDVSSWKIIMQAKFGLKFEKEEIHRAFDDVNASIAELQYYLGKLKDQ
jgi:oligoribonuclease